MKQEDIFDVLKYYKKQKFFLILLMIFVSFLELIGISLVIPFVTVIIEPDLPSNLFFSFLIFENFDSKFLNTNCYFNFTFFLKEYL